MQSELRQDLVSGDWIVISPGRLKRPHDIVKKMKKRVRAPINSCAFENPQKNGNEEPILTYPDRQNWQIQILKNKYPVFVRKETCADVSKNGPYSVMDGRGYHELVITREHDKNFPRLTAKKANLVFRSFQDRYRTLAADACLAYISIFHNWGPNAGASVYHPHYQIIGLPVVPPDVDHSLEGSDKYFRKNKKCVHCVMIDWEKRKRGRVVYENSGVIAFAPFVSREPFELRIFPKKHLPYFEDASKEEMGLAVEALQRALQKIEKRLGDPDYNFFIHTAPVLKKDNHRHYHWHIEILPKMSISAGFELGTGIEITVVDPDEAAKILRNTK